MEFLDAKFITFLCNICIDFDVILKAVESLLFRSESSYFNAFPLFTISNVNFTAFNVNICIDFNVILLQVNHCNPDQSAVISLLFHCSLTAKVCSVGMKQGPRPSNLNKEV